MGSSRGTANCGKPLVVPVRKVSVDEKQQSKACSVPLRGSVPEEVARQIWFRQDPMHPRLGAGIEGSDSGERQNKFGNVTVAKIKQDGVATPTSELCVRPGRSCSVAANDP